MDMPKEVASAGHRSLKNPDRWEAYKEVVSLLLIGFGEQLLIRLLPQFLMTPYPGPWPRVEIVPRDPEDANLMQLGRRLKASFSSIANLARKMAECYRRLADLHADLAILSRRSGGDGSLATSVGFSLRMIMLDDLANVLAGIAEAMGSEAGTDGRDLGPGRCEVAGLVQDETSSPALLHRLQELASYLLRVTDVFGDECERLASGLKDLHELCDALDDERRRQSADSRGSSTTGRSGRHPKTRRRGTR